MFLNQIKAGNHFQHHVKCNGSHTRQDTWRIVYFLRCNSHSIISWILEYRTVAGFKNKNAKRTVIRFSPECLCCEAYGEIHVRLSQYHPLTRKQTLKSSANTPSFVTKTF